MRKLSIVIAAISFSQISSAYKGLGAASISKKDLQKFAPKTLDPKVSNEVRRFLDLKAPGFGRLSPDGKSLYFTWSISGSNQIWKLNGPNQFPQMITSGEERTTISGMTPDGKYVVINRDSNGQENPGIYLLSTQDNSLTEIYRKVGIQSFAQYISEDSKTIYFATNEKQRDSYAIYAYDIASKKIEEVFSQPGLWSIGDVHPTRDEWLLTKTISNTHSEFYTYDRKTKKLTPLLGQNDNEDYSVSYALKDNAYLVKTNKFGDFHQLYEWQLGGEFKLVNAPIKYDISDVNISKKRKLLFYSINEGGYERVKRLDPKTYKEISMPALEKISKDAASVMVANISEDERFITVAIVTSQRPYNAYIYDTQKDKITQWIIPSTPEIDLSKSVKEKLEYYTARDGTQIPMFVFRSEECLNKNCPVIVDFHGGPEGQSTPGFSIYSQLITREGFILVQPNVRGSEGYGKEWLNSDNGPKRLKVISDIEDCSVFIKKNWKKNGVTPKIGVMGGSYGGYSTLMAMSYFAGAYDAGVSIVGISNLTTFLMNTAPYRRNLRILEYGDPVKDAAALKQLSPVTHINKVKAPLMIIQGSEDPRVPVGEAVQMYKLLQKKKVPAELMIFPDEGHGSSKTSNQVLEIGHTIRFFKEHLKL
jgi:dipeptidyl aminopeptidase/acylaminoacyl peptidase